MSKCNKCGEYVDWNNPNIHYGGHKCADKSIDLKYSESAINTPEKTIPKLKLTWHDVFDGYKLYPEKFDSVLRYLKCTSYRYVAFNGVVYSVNDKNMENALCYEEEL